VFLEPTIKTNSGLRIVSGIFGLGVISKVLGFLSQIVVTALFGTTRLADTFYFSFSIQNTVANGIGGSVPAILVPKFVELRNRGRHEDARRFASIILTWSALLLTLLSALMTWKSRSIISDLGAFPHDSRDLAVGVFRACTPILMLMCMLQLLISLSQAEKRFLVPAAMGILHSVVFIGMLTVSRSYLGVYSLVIAATTGILSQVGFLCLYLRRSGRLRPALRMGRDDSEEFLRLWWPLLIGQFLSMAQVTANRTIASSLLVGSVAALAYAEALKGIFLELVVAPVAAMTFPHFAEKIVRGDFKTAWNDLQVRMLGLWFFLLPAIVLIWMFGERLIEILYQRGNFTARSTEMTASAFSIYSLGLIAESAHYLVARFYLAWKDTSTLVWLGIPATILFVVTSYYFSRTLLHNGVALGWVLMMTAQAVSAFMLLRSRLRFSVSKRFFVGIGKVSISLAVMILTMRMLNHLISISSQATLARLSWVSLKGLLGLSAYVAAAYTLKISRDCPFLAQLHPRQFLAHLQNRRTS
jgi:putative peptidoglycan lipid II flippase